MVLTKDSFFSMFRAVALLWQENAERLGEIDSRFGDGDHGVTIGKMANLILSRLNERQEESPKEFIESLGAGCMEIASGSVGPLYGVLLEGFAGPLTRDDTEIDAPTLKAMFSSARTALFEITRARVGDKTMMDVLIPATEAAENAPDDVSSILRAAATAASRGLRETENQVAKFGRARSYGEKTLGTPDAGAVSAALLFRGFQLCVEENLAYC
jgi:dihydroxyacetone kinase-like protein